MSIIDDFRKVGNKSSLHPNIQTLQQSNRITSQQLLLFVCFIPHVLVYYWYEKGVTTNER